MNNSRVNKLIIYKMTHNELKLRIDSFATLKKDWDGYDADEITAQSIVKAHEVLETLLKDTDIDSIFVFPMRNGGIQFEIGEYKEIEIFNDNIKEINFDKDFNII